MNFDNTLFWIGVAHPGHWLMVAVMVVAGFWICMAPLFLFRGHLLPRIPFYVWMAILAATLSVPPAIGVAADAHQYALNVKRILHGKFIVTAVTDLHGDSIGVYRVTAQQYLHTDIILGHAVPVETHLDRDNFLISASEAERLWPLFVAQERARYTHQTMVKR